MNTVQKIGLAFVGAAMFYTAVAPKNQTAKVLSAGGKIWTTSLALVTGQKAP